VPRRGLVTIFKRGRTGTETGNPLSEGAYMELGRENRAVAGKKSLKKKNQFRKKETSHQERESVG